MVLLSSNSREVYWWARESEGGREGGREGEVSDEVEGVTMTHDMVLWTGMCCLLVRVPKLCRIPLAPEARET